MVHTVWSLQLILNRFISDEGKGLCLYDKNELPCCTKNYELFKSWQKEGWVEGYGPYQNILDKQNVKKNLQYIHKHKLRMSASYVYGVRQKSLKSKWNFVCPIHHEVPTVAILLGMFQIISLYRLYCIAYTV